MDAVAGTSTASPHTKPEPRTHPPANPVCAVRVFSSTAPMENHIEQFRGWWIPADVVHLLQGGKINPRELCLLATVDGLVSPARGCYASNAYLAKSVGVSERAVQLMLNRLCDMRLVVVVTRTPCTRELETAWSRTRAPITEGAQKIARRGRKKLRPDTRTDNHTPHGGGGVHVEEENEMPFFNRDATLDGPATPTDKDYAHRLAEMVLRHRKKRSATTSVKAWAEAFRKLREIDGVDQARIDAAFAWYMKNFTGRYTPRAYSGDGFRERFLKIEDAMGRDRAERGEDIRISKRALKIVERLGTCQWPNGSDTQLPAAVERSLAAHAALVLLMDRVAKHAPNKRTARFATFALTQMGDAPGFVETWFRNVSRDVAGWDAWTGDLRPFILTTDAKALRKMGRAWATNYTGAATAWDDLTTAMGDIDAD